MSLYTKIISIISGTPSWVWLVFIFVLYRGFQVRKSRTLSVYKLGILPTLFLALSIQGICTLQCPMPGMGILWCGGLLLGIISGWYLFKTSSVKADKKKALIKIPGSPLILILSLVIFASKYYMGYLAATNPALLLQTHMMIVRILLSSVIPGLVVGRTARYVYLYTKAVHTDL
jgi:hypothetical protein